MAKTKLSAIDKSQIIKFVDGGLRFQLIGEHLEVTRERVRQVYKEKTGHGHPVRKPVTNKIKHAIKIYCSLCGGKFDRSSNGRFCSPKCHGKYHAREYGIDDIKKCYNANCRQRFFPFRNKKYGKHGRYFCDTFCYLSYGKIISEFKDWVSKRDG